MAIINPFTVLIKVSSVLLPFSVFILLFCRKEQNIMFSFGLFTSHIPYIVFAAIYLLYFGANYINKARVADDNNVIEKNEKYEIKQHSDYYAVDEDFSSSGSSTVMHFSNHLKNIFLPNQRLRMCFRKEHIHYALLIPSILSRPPPTPCYVG